MDINDIDIFLVSDNEPGDESDDKPLDSDDISLEFDNMSNNKSDNKSLDINDIKKFFKHENTRKILTNKYIEYRTWNCKQYAKTLSNNTSTTAVGDKIISKLNTIGNEEIPINLRAIIKETIGEKTNNPVNKVINISTVNSAVDKYTEHIKNTSEEIIKDLIDDLMFYVQYYEEDIKQVYAIVVGIKNSKEITDDKTFKQVDLYYSRLQRKASLGKKKKHEPAMRNANPKGGSQGGGYVGTLRF